MLPSSITLLLQPISVLSLFTWLFVCAAMVGLTIDCCASKKKRKRRRRKHKRAHSDSGSRTALSESDESHSNDRPKKHKSRRHRHSNSKQNEKHKSNISMSKRNSKTKKGGSSRSGRLDRTALDVTPRKQGLKKEPPKHLDEHDPPVCESKEGRGRKPTGKFSVGNDDGQEIKPCRRDDAMSKQKIDKIKRGERARNAVDYKTMDCVNETMNETEIPEEKKIVKLRIVNANAPRDKEKDSPSSADNKTQEISLGPAPPNEPPNASKSNLCPTQILSVAPRPKADPDHLGG